MQTPDPAFILNGSTLVAVGSVIGSLAGAIGFLFKALLAAKQEQLKDRDDTIDDLIIERNGYRDALYRVLGSGEKATQIAEEATKVAAQVIRESHSRRGSR